MDLQKKVKNPGGKQITFLSKIVQDIQECNGNRTQNRGVIDKSHAGQWVKASLSKISD